MGPQPGEFDEEGETSIVSEQRNFRREAPNQGLVTLSRRWLPVSPMTIEPSGATATP